MIMGKIHHAKTNRFHLLLLSGLKLFKFSSNETELPMEEKQPSSLCPSIFLLEDKYRDVWVVPSGIRDICWAKQINK